MVTPLTFIYQRLETIRLFIPDKINSDGNTANELAVKIINREHNFQKLLANPEFCGPLEPTIKYTKPMLGFKDFNSAHSIIDGIEAIAMLRKNQSVFSEINGRVLSIADQINLLVA